MFNQKGSLSLILGTILVIIVVGVGIYYSGIRKNTYLENHSPFNSLLTQNSTNPDENNITLSVVIPTNWNSYSNSKYRFSFQYPAEWVYDDTSTAALGVGSEKLRSGYHIILGPKNDINNTNDPESSDPKTSGPISIHINNLENYAFYSSNLGSYFPEPSSKETIKLPNLTVYTIHHKACPNNIDCLSVILKKEENIFIFDLWDWENRYKDLNTVYQIITSLKFMD